MQSQVKVLKISVSSTPTSYYIITLHPMFSTVNLTLNHSMLLLQLGMFTQVLIF